MIQSSLHHQQNNQHHQHHHQQPYPIMRRNNNSGKGRHVISLAKDDGTPSPTKDDRPRSAPSDSPHKTEGQRLNKHHHLGFAPPPPPSGHRPNSLVKDPQSMMDGRYLSPTPSSASSLLHRPPSNGIYFILFILYILFLFI